MPKMEDLPSAVARLRAAPERWGPSYTWFVPLAPAAIEALQPIASSATPAADAARRLL
jgi:hypothetical protein